MPRRHSWKDLTVGLFALVATIGVAFVVLVFARIGTLHGDTFRLFAFTGEARGIIQGSDVWLAGQKVGLVKDVEFMPPSADSSHRLLIAMDVLSNARQGIRANSTAQIRAGGTLIGAQVVYLTIGTNTAPEVKSGDTIRALPQSDLETMSSQFAVASQQFPAIIDNIKLLDHQLNSVKGTLGAFGLEHGGVELARAQNQLSRLSTRATQSHGTVALALASPSLVGDRARHVMAQADSIRALVNGGGTSYGRFRSDSLLLGQIADIRKELDLLSTRMASTSGTLGRARADSALLQEIAGARREITLIMADIRRRPLHYVHF
jgi:phospholipid/cholesterol/gamma-HCH transport system substrate-binding protein